MGSKWKEFYLCVPLKGREERVVGNVLFLLFHMKNYSSSSIMGKTKSMGIHGNTNDFLFLLVSSATSSKSKKLDCPFGILAT